MPALESIYVGFRTLWADPNNPYIVYVNNPFFLNPSVLDPVRNLDGVEHGQPIDANFLGTAAPDGFTNMRIIKWNYFRQTYGITGTVRIHQIKATVQDSIAEGQKAFYVQRYSDFAKLLDVDMSGQRTVNADQKFEGGYVELAETDKLMIESIFVPNGGMSRTLGMTIFFTRAPA